MPTSATLAGRHPGGSRRRSQRHPSPTGDGARRRAVAGGAGSAGEAAAPQGKQMATAAANALPSPGTSTCPGREGGGRVLHRRRWLDDAPRRADRPLDAPGRRTAQLTPRAGVRAAPGPARALAELLRRASARAPLLHVLPRSCTSPGPPGPPWWPRHARPPTSMVPSGASGESPESDPVQGSAHPRPGTREAAGHPRREEGGDDGGDATPHAHADPGVLPGIEIAGIRPR